MSRLIVIIEDDAKVGELVARYLEREGFAVITAVSGRLGLAEVTERRPELVLLDVNLPDIDGWSILRRLRDNLAWQPAVIMLTARSDEPDRLLGLDLGADDYVIKPFSPREVVARVKAVLRRAVPARESQEALLFSGLRIDLAGRTVWRDEMPVELTPKEFDLLVELARQPGRVLPRLALYDVVWGDDAQGDTHTLDVHINRLRRKLAGNDGRAFVRTIRSIGFKFEATDDAP